MATRMGCSGSEPGPSFHSWMELLELGEQNTNPRVTHHPYLFTQVSHDFWQPPHGLLFEAQHWWVQPWEGRAMGTCPYRSLWRDVSSV